MKPSPYLAAASAVLALLGSAASATLPAPTAKTPTNEQARLDCYLLAPYRRQACFRSLLSPRDDIVVVWDAGSAEDVAAVEAAALGASPAHDEVKGADAEGLAERDVSEDLGDHLETPGEGGEDGKARHIHKKPVVTPTPFILPTTTFYVGGPTHIRFTYLNDPAVTSEDGKMHWTLGKKRDLAVTALDAAGAIDLAIPVDVAPAATSPVPTTLRTVTTMTASPTRLDPITVDEALTMGTTTYPVHRTLQNATLANGTEIRIEQTESQVHDVHIEETEHEKNEPEQDKVIVHVKVFVEHVKEAAARAKRWLPPWGDRTKRNEGVGGNAGLEGSDRKWGCYCKWYGCFCGYHGQDKEEGWQR